MDEAVEKMEAQLKLWRLKIDDLAAKTEMAGSQARFDALIYVDELKALHAIAQLKLDEFRAAGDTERKRLKAGMKKAWRELEAAFKNSNPSP
jgi:hypothetical protein